MFCGHELPLSSELLACKECTATLPFTENDGCFAGTEHVAYVVAPFFYVEPVKRALQRYKFKKRKAYAESLGHYLVGYLSRIGEICSADLVIPVPLGEKRLYERGFNQSELLAQIVSRELGLVCDTDTLLRVRETRRQSSLSMAERTANVTDAFGCAQAIEGKTVLLIDDIFTTGATAENCARALKDAGAVKVILAAMATVSRSVESGKSQNRITPIRTK